MRFLVGILTLVLAARPAGACGVPDFADVVAAVAEALDPKTEEVHAPVLEVGGGMDLHTGVVSLGYGWGERDRGGLFPGSSITRVVGDARISPDQTTLALTYGWYETQVLSAGFDIGAQKTLGGGAGPTARLSLGADGLLLRLDGGFEFGAGDPRFVGDVAVIADLTELSGKI